MMRKSTTILLLLAAIPLLFSFSIFKSITLPAWYIYAGPYDVEYKLTDIRPGELFFYFDHNAYPVYTETTNFIWSTPQTDSLFTAYLLNLTYSAVNLTHQDRSFIMIQEAQDPTGKWAPIEVWQYSTCGNSYFGSPTIGKNQYVMVSIPKYKGKFQTKIRLKLKVGKGVLYSESFKGSVDPGQFKKEQNLGFRSYLDEK